MHTSMCTLTHTLTGVADGLDLVDVVLLDDGVKGSVQLVQQVHDLHGRTAGREGGEADDVAEENGGAAEPFGLYRHSLLQAVSHPARQDAWTV